MSDRLTHPAATVAASGSVAGFQGIATASTTDAYRVAESPVPDECPEIVASGLVVRPGEESGVRGTLKILWQAAVPGLIAVGGFCPMEVDRPDLPENPTTSSWDNEQQPTPATRTEGEGRLTWAQAGAVAIEVFEQAEKEIQAEREAEARFLASLWEDEDL
jgi:hypothetical protein